MVNIFLLLVLKPLKVVIEIYLKLGYNIFGADFANCVVNRVDYFNRLFRDIFKTNITLKEETITH